jgi:hypothetical protein
VQAAVYLEKELRWRARLEFSCESANLALLQGDTAEALDAISNAARIADGRGWLLTPLMGFDKLRAFAALHERGCDEAHDIIDSACAHYRDRNPLGYFEALAVRSWVERQEAGSISPTTAAALAEFDHHPVRGRREVLIAQGFLPGTQPAELNRGRDR